MAEYHLTTPLKEKDILKLKIGDKVFLSGMVITARDKAHQYLLDKKVDINLKGGVIYHCGPVVSGKYKIVAAGPTTSNRMSKYEPEVLKKYGIKAIIGKGGMDKGVLNALKKNKAVYLSAIGGAAVLIAESIVKVKGVLKLEFGIPEALWILEVNDFPTIVTMDAHGNSLHEKVLKISEKMLR